MTIRIEEVLFAIGVVSLFYQWRLNVASKRRKERESKKEIENDVSG